MTRPDSTKVCEYCGEAFAVKYPRNPNRYCSYDCRNAAYRGSNPNRQKRVSFTCETCGETTWICPSHASRRRYCSRACDPHFSGERVAVECESCGTVVQRQPSVANRFCSNECRLAWFSSHFVGENSPQWRGGTISYYGPNWKVQKRLALERDGYACRFCGADGSVLGEAPSVHHLMPFKTFGVDGYKAANALGNLVSLCRSCHQRVERAKGDDYHPPQRVKDLVAFAREILELYGDEF